MWRFVLAGMITVSGVVLLFVASFGDPSAALRDVRALLPVVQANTAVTTAAAPASPQPAAAPPSAPDTVALERQRDELHRQLQDLQAMAAKASGDADAARRELDSLRERRAADQAASEQSRQEAQREIEASQQRASEAEKQAAAEKAALDRLRVETERVQAQARAEPPKEVKPAQDTGPAHVAEAQRPPPPPSPAAGGPPKPAASTVKPARAEPGTSEAVKPAPAAHAEQSPAPVKLAANAPQAPKPVPPAAKRPESDPNSPEAVLNKLRHAPSLRGQAETEAVSDRLPAAPPEQRSALPRERLLNARAALAAGRIDEARRLLEQSQVQLVLRSSDPSGTPAAANSVAAGQVAEALSMLGAGDVPRAMRYIDLAVPQVGNGRSGALQAVTTAQPSRDGEEAAPGYGFRDNYPSDYRYRPTSRQ